jgi:hypothetical protein
MGAKRAPRPGFSLFKLARILRQLFIMQGIAVHIE